MTALPPDNRDTPPDEFDGDQVETGEELFEPGEARMPLVADRHREPSPKKPSHLSDSGRHGDRPRRGKC